ncbi:hypothetical protein Enr13x_42240 [Stieleria neptunia]|uniref:Uncharacterized protein n=1 Tax=Stieleria neptunia TaxID=2527979 RepID=A0A518HU59_9BACT|nr:hypothetical protein Enr13x_42240 [Stieleria neptunia]
MQAEDRTEPMPIVPKRACRCFDCRTRIDRGEYAYSVNGRTMCTGCKTRYQWSEAAGKWLIF